VHNPQYRFFEVNAAGEETKELLRRYIGHDDRKGSPLIQFRLGDLWGRTFMREAEPDKDPQPGAAMKARLIKADVVDMSAMAEISEHRIITHGVGWLNRVELVSPAGGDAFVSCRIAALSGNMNEPARRYLEALASTPSTEHLLRRCKQAVDARQKVFICFDLSDLRISPYLRTPRDTEEEAESEDRSMHAKVGYNLKADLAEMKSISINGVKVYPVPDTEVDTDNASRPMSEEAAPEEAEPADADLLPY